MYNDDDYLTTLPVDLDPDRHGIICRHFFDIDPEELRHLRGPLDPVDDPLGSLASDVVTVLRRVGPERGSMTQTETVAGEYADHFPGDSGHVDLEQDRPRFLVIEWVKRTAATAALPNEVGWVTLHEMSKL